jgi:hypothetical protein
VPEHDGPTRLWIWFWLSPRMATSFLDRLIWPSTKWYSLLVLVVNARPRSPRIAAWCETGAVSAGARARELHESDRSRGSVAATSWCRAFCSRPAALAALAGAKAVGEIYRTPPLPSFVATLDHTFLELCGESYLRNPLRGNLHGGVCEGGERWCCHGGPKRARSWKRRIEPRNT